MEWVNDGPWTINAVGKWKALVADENGKEFAAAITDLTPIPETVTIEISVKHAEELVRIVDDRDDLRLWLYGTSWPIAAELRLKAKLQAALAGEK